MQPFNFKTLLTLVLAFVCFLIAYWLFKSQTGFLWMVLRSFVFLIPFIAGAIILNLSPDVKPVISTITKRLGTRF
jgi:hypothetical protein